MANNPFIPAFGELPGYLAGRQEALGQLSAAFESDVRSPQLCSLISGPRGSGKTTMLVQISELAKERGWLAVRVTTQLGMLEEIYDTTCNYAQHLTQIQQRMRVKQISLGSLFGIGLEHEAFRELSWRTRIENVLKVLTDEGIGLLLLVDEVTPQLPEMIQLAATYQVLACEGYKVALVMAGLPGNVSALFVDESVSFLRRAWHYRLGNVSHEEACLAFKKPIVDAGKTIDDDALEQIAMASMGFPYMIQLVGYYVWELSGGDGVIALEHAQLGIDKAMEHMKIGVYEGSYQELSDGDKRFLIAMLPDEEESILADIAQRMAVKSNYASRYKARLLEQGIIGEYGRNRFRFEIPGFREYFEEESEFEREELRAERQARCFAEADEARASGKELG